MLAFMRKKTGRRISIVDRRKDDPNFRRLRIDDRLDVRMGRHMAAMELGVVDGTPEEEDFVAEVASALSAHIEGMLDELVREGRIGPFALDAPESVIGESDRLFWGLQADRTTGREVHPNATMLRPVGFRIALIDGRIRQILMYTGDLFDRMPTIGEFTTWLAERGIQCEKIGTVSAEAGIDRYRALPPGVPVMFETYEQEDVDVVWVGDNLDLDDPVPGAEDGTDDGTSAQNA
jgi:hypothetical protein